MLASASTGFLANLSCSQAISGDAQVQPVLMGLQLGLTDLWRSYGVHPDAVIGHSMGEVTAAVVSGALSVADGLKVIAFRSRLMSTMAGQGAVALVELDPAVLKALRGEINRIDGAPFAPRRQRSGNHATCRRLIFFDH